MNKLQLKIPRILSIPRNHISMLLLSLVVLLSGCSGNMDDLSITNSTPITSTAGVSRNITKYDAIAIANKVLKKKGTRGDILNLPSFEYVVGGLLAVPQHLTPWHIAIKREWQ